MHLITDEDRAACADEFPDPAAPAVCQHTVEDVWAIVTSDAARKTEGIVTIMQQGIGATMLMTSDKNQIDGLVQYAQQIVNDSKKPMTLVHFVRSDVVEELQPKIIIEAGSGVTLARPRLVK